MYIVTIEGVKKEFSSYKKAKEYLRRERGKRGTLGRHFKCSIEGEKESDDE